MSAWRKLLETKLLSLGEEGRTSTYLYHLTSRARFKLDPKKVPSDNSVAIYSREAPGVFLVSADRVESWINGHGYVRPFVVEIKVDIEAVRPERWSGEVFLPVSNFDRAEVIRVLPLDAFCREEFGAYGWTESFFGTTFDTEEPIPKEELRKSPFRGWRWPGDARALSLLWVSKYKSRVADYLRRRR